MKWFRFYSEFRSDPKLKRMPVHHRYAFVILLCLANDNKNRGQIDGLDDDDIAYELEMETEDWLTLKAKFRVKGLIEFSGDQITITNWDKRQFVSDSSAERVAKHRSKKKEQECNVTSALLKRDVTPSDTDTDSEPDSDTELKTKNGANAPSCSPAEIGSVNRSTPTELLSDSQPASLSKEVDSPATQIDPGEGESSAAREKTSAKKKGNTKTEKACEALEYRDKFESFFKWYSEQCKSRNVKPGGKLEAAQAWKKSIESDMENFERFRLGCKLFFQGDVRYGIPNACRFLAGSRDHPTPYWLSELEAIEASSVAVDDFIEIPKKEYFEAQPEPEIDRDSSIEAFEKIKAQMKARG